MNAPVSRSEAFGEDTVESREAVGRRHSAERDPGSATRSMVATIRFGLRHMLAQQQRPPGRSHPDSLCDRPPVRWAIVHRTKANTTVSK